MRPSPSTSKALEIQPDYAEAHNNLGLALAAAEQFDEAIAHYRKALEIKPDDARPTTTSATPWPPRTVDEADRPLPEGPGNRSRLTRMPTTTSATSWPTADEFDGGHRPLPEGPGNQARLRGCPLQPRQRSGPPRAFR